MSPAVNDDLCIFSGKIEGFRDNIGENLVGAVRIYNHINQGLLSELNLSQPHDLRVFLLGIHTVSLNRLIDALSNAKQLLLRQESVKLDLLEVILVDNQHLHDSHAVLYDSKSLSIPSRARLEQLVCELRDHYLFFSKFFVDASVCHRQDLVVFNMPVLLLELCQVLHVDQITHLALEHDIEELDADTLGLFDLDGEGVRVVNLIGELSPLAEPCEGIRVFSVDIFLTLLLHTDDVKKTDAVVIGLRLVLALILLRIVEILVELVLWAVEDGPTQWVSSLQSCVLSFRL